MNLWEAFFSTQQTELPQFGFTWYVSTFALLALTIYLAYRYGEKSLSKVFPDFTGSAVNPSLRLVFSKSDASN